MNERRSGGGSAAALLIVLPFWLLGRRVEKRWCRVGAVPRAASCEPVSAHGITGIGTRERA
ncbi:hypothetical protein [Sinimarinibacterium thermocellulolyticum]|uniref:Uncharacterized protein n=1 Tax=Sinimarinibacterium thermocellulolyticum TaxID=3170016 RepID=A0ABV2ABN4_9GAMM